MVKKTKKIILIDGNALVHRAFYALPPLTTPQGELVNAVYGFTTILFKALSQLKPDYLVCTFDYPAATFRHKKYKAYKAQRQKAPSELYKQIPKTQELVKVLGIPIFEKEGYEADDLIASLTQRIKKRKDLEVIILTGDLDELQLVDERTKVYTMRRGFSDIVIYDVDKVKEKFSLLPSQLVDYKALRGDPSDNIPGVAGIGEKTAADLIKKYGTLENVFDHLDELSPKIQKLLLSAKKEAFLSKELAQLVNDLPLSLDLEKCRFRLEGSSQAIKFFSQLGFKSLIKRIFGQEIKERKSKQIPARNFFNQKKIEAWQIDRALESILKKMESHGVLVDTAYLKRLNQKVSRQLLQKEKEIYESVGHQFNINSPSQLAHVLFTELSLPPVKKTKTGFSTDTEVLQELLGTHPVIDLILSYREIFKIKSTYLDKLPQLVDENNRIHTTYTQDTATGRLASRNPNLQNIPVKEGLGEKIRKAFIAPPGYQLLGADYSQIELRIIASLSGDEKMITAFQEDKDIHAQTAAEIFKVKINEVTPQMRRLAKTVNFGIIYGMGPHGLSQRLKISYEEAESYIDEYFAHHPGIKNYIDKIKERAQRLGYVETLFGRKRYFPQLKLGRTRSQRAAFRMAINAPIQGTAADLIKLAMIRIDQELPRVSQNSAMILQVHDELVFEVFLPDIEKVKRLVKEKMENVYPLKVPIKVEIAVGNNWGELK